MPFALCIWCFLPTRNGQPQNEMVKWSPFSAIWLQVDAGRATEKETQEAEDGSWHSFLLKGRDDLRLDGRIMQLLRMAPCRDGARGRSLCRCLGTSIWRSKLSVQIISSTRTRELANLGYCCMSFMGTTFLTLDRAYLGVTDVWT